MESVLSEKEGRREMWEWERKRGEEEEEKEE